MYCVCVRTRKTERACLLVMLWVGQPAKATIAPGYHRKGICTSIDQANMLDGEHGWRHGPVITHIL